MLHAVANRPDSKVHGAYMGPTWGRQDPGGPHVVPIIPIIWVHIACMFGQKAYTVYTIGGILFANTLESSWHVKNICD